MHLKMREKIATNKTECVELKVLRELTGNQLNSDKKRYSA